MSTDSLNLYIYPQEKAILSIRKSKYVRVDVVRRSSDEAYVDGSGQTVAATTFTWGNNNPGMGSERCLGVGYVPLTYYDYFCDVDDSDYPETWCVA